MYPPMNWPSEDVDSKPPPDDILQDILDYIADCKSESVADPNPSVKFEVLDDDDEVPDTPTASRNAQQDSTHDSNGTVRGYVGSNICAVCGDYANGFHYDVSSCNGCKTFFRRTVVNGRSFTCRHGGNCQFTKDHRCACRACRFQRCIDAGMNPKAIQYTPSANLILSIARKRMKQSSEAGCRQLPQSVVSAQDEVLKLIGCVLRLEENHDRLRCSTFFPYDFATTIDDILKRPSAFGQAEKYPLVERWPERPKKPFHDNRVHNIRIGIKFWKYLDLYLGIEYLKTFGVLESLSEDDKVALAKGTVIPLSLLGSSHYAYSQHHDVVVQPDGSLPFDYRTEDERPDVEKQLSYGVVPYFQALKPDQIQYCLLRAITALNDAAPGLSSSAQNAVSQERSKYAVVLLRYLQNKHGTEKGTKDFAETMQFICNVYKEQQISRQYFAYRQYVLRKNDPSNLWRQCLGD